MIWCVHYYLTPLKSLAHLFSDPFRQGARTILRNFQTSGWHGSHRANFLAFELEAYPQPASEWFNVSLEPRSHLPVCTNQLER
jgi:hypothetical protein